MFYNYLDLIIYINIYNYAKSNHSCHGSLASTTKQWPYKTDRVLSAIFYKTVQLMNIKILNCRTKERIFIKFDFMHLIAFNIFNIKNIL